MSKCSPQADGRGLTDVTTVFGVSSMLTILALYQPNPPPSSPDSQHSAASGGVPQQAYAELTETSNAPPQSETGWISLFCAVSHNKRISIHLSRQQSHGGTSRKKTERHTVRTSLRTPIAPFLIRAGPAVRIPHHPAVAEAVAIAGVVEVRAGVVAAVLAGAAAGGVEVRGAAVGEVALLCGCW